MKVNVNIIKEYMSRENLNKQEFCKRCGISIYLLNKFLSGNINCDIYKAVKMLNCLGAKCDDLFIKQQ